MNLHRLTITFVSMGILIAISDVSLAQKARSRGFASLGEMKCKQTGGNLGSGLGSGYLVANEDVAIGRQSLRAMAVLGSTYFLGGGGGILNREPTEVVCSLAPVNASPPFKTLNLAFGVSGKADEALMMRLTVYKDGNVAKSETFGYGELLKLPIDVTGTRSIALEAECLRSQDNNTCPNIIFFDDTLIKINR